LILTKSTFSKLFNPVRVGIFSAIHFILLFDPFRILRFNPFRVDIKGKVKYIILFDPSGINSLLLSALRKILVILFSFYTLSAQPLFNEFMIDPDNDNTGEFIEIYNAGDSVINMSMFYICDAQDTDAIIPFPDSLLLPGHYGLILDPNYSQEYDHLIPDSIPRFSIPDSRFGMYGVSNSTQKSFALLFPDRYISDSYLTGDPIWPDAGYSIERIRSQDSLWGSSSDLFGTPGFRNSISPKDREIHISSLACETSEDVLSISFSINNTGLLEIADYYYGYIVDISPHFPELNDTVVFYGTSPICPGDSMSIEQDYHYRSKGHLTLFAFVSCNEIPADTQSIDVNIPLYENDLIINEFVCKTGDNFSGEYIEILSLSNMPIQIKGLLIEDMTGSVELERDHVLYPDSMLVLAQSASFYDDFPNVKNAFIPPAWRSLNNSEDVIRFLNRSGSIICDLHYDAVWDIPPDCAMQLVDTALNYRDPLNWEISYWGSPGKYNQTEKQLLHLSCFTQKELFTPLDTLSIYIINDGYFSLPDQTIILSTPLVEHSYFISKSIPGDTLLLRVDTSDVFIEGTQACTLTCWPYFTYYFKYYYPYSDTPCHFNEILFEPMDTYGQAEFIELSCKNKPFDLDHWKLKVNNTTVTLEGMLENTYNVLCDSDDPLGSYTYPFDNFPSLPNSGADCYLLDPMKNIIDHCDLRDHGELHEGKSLEKQFVNISSNDPNIWFSSVSPSAMTPGRLNSITALPGSRNDLDIYPDIFSPGIDDRIQFSIDSETSLLYCELMCFNLAGQLIYRKEQALFSQPSCLLFWDGRMENGDYPSRGLYLAVVVMHQIDGSSYQLRETFAIK